MNDFLDGAKPVAPVVTPPAQGDFLADAKPVAAPAAKPGFFHELAASFGISPEQLQSQNEDMAKHPIVNALKSLSGPAGQVIEGLYNQGKLSLGEVKQAVHDVANGNGSSAAVHAVNAVPVVGPGLVKAAANASLTPGSYAHQVGQVVADPGTMGTIVGTAAQAAPIVAGAVEKIPAGDTLLAKSAAAAKLPLRAAQSAAVATGEAAENAGTGLMNKTVGTLKSDFKRGANPARGYFATDNGPAMSMRSIADKATSSLDEVGQKLGDAYRNETAKGTLIPFDDVAGKMASTIQKAIDLETGPGGTGNVTAIKSYIEQFEPTFAKAEARGGFTPSEVFDMKRAIAQNTNWSDPAQFSLKTVRQQQVGALSGILSDAIPETKELNQNYQDLTKLAARAEERASTGSRPLTAHIYKNAATLIGATAGAAEGHTLLGAATGAALDSVPFKTTLATGLVRGGRALQSLAPSEAPTVEGMASNNVPQYHANGENNNPQLAPPGPQQFPPSPNPTMLRGLPSGTSTQQLPASTNGEVSAPSNAPPPFNAAAARMRIRPTQFAPQPTPTASSGTIPVSPEGQAGVPDSRFLNSPQAPASTPSLTGKALWAARGTEKVIQHLQKSPVEGLVASDIEALAKTPNGKKLLVIASDLTPGSAAMKNLMAQIKALQGVK